MKTTLLKSQTRCSRKSLSNPSLAFKLYTPFKIGKEFQVKKSGRIKYVRSTGKIKNRKKEAVQKGDRRYSSNRKLSQTNSF